MLTLIIITGVLIVLYGTFNDIEKKGSRGEKFAGLTIPTKWVVFSWVLKLLCVGLVLNIITITLILGLWK